MNWQEADTLLREWSREMGCCFTWETHLERAKLTLIKRGRTVTVEAENLPTCFDWIAPLMRADIANAALDRITKEIEP